MKRFLTFLKNNYQRILYFAVLVSFIGPIIFIVTMMILGNAPKQGSGNHARGDYMLMLLECILGVFVINVPAILEKRLKFELPTILYILYIVFLYCSIVLGEVRSFYYDKPYWDVYLHALSSIMTGLFGYLVVTILNRDDKIIFKLSPFFVAMFAFSFSVMIGSVWEIYEFACDGFFHMNMQKHTLADGTPLQGHAALTDTMKDIIVDTFGALLASVAGYFSIRNDRHWFSAKLKKDSESDKSRHLKNKEKKPEA